MGAMLWDRSCGIHEIVGEKAAFIEFSIEVENCHYKLADFYANRHK
jgi:hypothetical protein